MSSLTTIAASDKISDSRAVINTNFEALNTDKAESSTVTTHTSATEAHSATGAVVGTTNSQVLTNKTLTTPVINGAVTGTITPPKTFYGTNFHLPEGTMYNGKISPTVTSNNLTVALKTLAGTDPSATDPVYVMIGGVLRSITSALSFTCNAGSNWLNMGSAELATKEVDLFAYISYRTTSGTMQLLASRFPGANILSDFTLVSPETAEKGILYNSGPTGDNGDAVVNIGRFAATLSAGAGYTWTVPTYTTSNLIQRPIYETRALSYTSTNNVTNCTGTGGYQIIGNRIKGWLKLALTGAPGFDGTHMPARPFLTSSNIEIGDHVTIGYGGYLDSGTAAKPLSLAVAHSANSNLCFLFAANGAILSNSAPITWANNDIISANFDYEI